MVKCQQRESAKENQKMQITENGQLHIREVKQEDRGKLIDLMSQLGYEIDPNDMAENIETYLRNPDYAAFCALIGDEIVGLVSIIIIRLINRRAKYARISALIIDKEHRNKGYGSILLSYAESYAFSQGCDKIELTSGFQRRETGAHQFYRSQGYADNVTVYFRK